MNEHTLGFCDFIDGDCITPNDGQEKNGAIILCIRVSAPTGHSVTVNGTYAYECEPGVYQATVVINGYRTAVVARDETEKSERRINLFRFSDAVGKYRVSSDDNILFLQDLTEHSELYPSIFDHPYLAVYKKAHDLYGAKVHLNLFYELCEKSRKYFTDRPNYFNLSMMTEKYKAEFQANSNWLKLAFHSKAEFPASPYAASTADEVTADCISVYREIMRFAGIESISNSTTIHYGSGNREVVRALRSLGFRSLTGYLDADANGNPIVSYYIPSNIISHIKHRDFWVDTQEDMIFGKIDKVMNLNDLERVKQDVIASADHPHRGSFVSIMIHEQYFYSGYRSYLPDFEERVLSSCKLLCERGYIGAHISDVTKEPELRNNPLFAE